MNDRYLYRAKRKNWRELPKEVWWVEGYYAFVDNHHYIYTGNLCNGGLYVVAERFEIDIDTLCACTGLKDKNGKLIWENDIVSGKMYLDHGQWGESVDDKRIVEWDDAYARFVPCSYMKLDKYEVIGNVFDNPELLE